MRSENTKVMSPWRIVSAYLAEAKFECLRVLRSPEFTIPMLLLPLGFYLLLGIAMAGMRAQRQGPGDVFIFVSFLVYGIVAPGLLGVSSLLASDRVQGIVEYKRALPAPFGSLVIGSRDSSCDSRGYAAGTRRQAAARRATSRPRRDLRAQTAPSDPPRAHANRRPRRTVETEAGIQHAEVHPCAGKAGVRAQGVPQQ
jgi:hypothetical protein